MSSISNITTACKGLVDLMGRTSQGWHDMVQKSFYDHRLNPLIGTAADYQSAVYNYIRLIDDYDRRMAALADTSPMGTGIGEHELFRQQSVPNLLEQIMNRQR